MSNPLGKDDMTLTENHFKHFSDRLEYAVENVSPTLAKAASEALDRRVFSRHAPFACEYHKRLNTKTKEVASYYMKRANAVVDEYLQSSATERLTHDDKNRLLEILNETLNLEPFDRCAETFEERLLTQYKSLGVSVTVGIEGALKRNAAFAASSLKLYAHNAKRDTLKTIDFKLQERTFDNPAATETYSVDYVNTAKIAEISQLEGSFDTCRLVKLCEELNIAHQNECYYSTLMLLRAIKDHVPKVFGHENFEQVAANAKRTNKDIYLRLQNQLKDVADIALHRPIRQHDSLLTASSVQFQSDIEHLLSEFIVRYQEQCTADSAVQR